MKKKSIIIISIFYLLLSYSLYLILREETITSLLKEDGVVEWAGALSWLIASIIFFYLFFNIDSGNKFFRFETKRNIFFFFWEYYSLLLSVKKSAGVKEFSKFKLQIILLGQIHSKKLTFIT